MSPQKAKILVVDDDPIFLSIMAKFFAKEEALEVYQAKSGEEGIRISHEIRPDLIISDYYMPGMDGFEFCRYVKTNPELSSTMFILLSAEKDVSKKVTGYEHGADDYVEKAGPAEILMGKVKVFLRIKNLQDELRVEREKLLQANESLERNFTELTSILLRILDIRFPGADDRAQLAKAAAEYIADHYDLEKDERKRITFGAMLHEIGKMGLPDGITRKNYKTLDATERTVFHQHPVIGSAIVSALSGFTDAADAIHHQFENYDGSGMPAGLMGDEISLGARILRAIVFQEESFEGGLSTGEVIERAKISLNKALDPGAGKLLIDYLRERDQSLFSDKRKVGIDELTPGMTVAEDVYASSGVKLLPEGAVLDEHMLERLMERNNADPIIEGVYVYRG